MIKCAEKKIKNKIRTFEPEIGLEFKNAQAEIRIPSSYKVKRVYRVTATDRETVIDRQTETKTGKDKKRE